MIENPTQSILDKLGHGARATSHHAILLSILARSGPVICAVLLLSVHLVVAVVGLVRVLEEPLHQGGDHREVPEVRHKQRGGRRHEDLPRAGRGQCGDGALLLLLVSNK